MKINKLYIKNIASIEKAEIDFSKGILSKEPIFLITGENGSGKSTILDAICMALYNTTPRLETSSNREKFDDTTLKDVRNLLRRGTGEGEVRLDFEANDTKPYRVTWSVHRAHNKPDGALQPVLRELTDLKNNLTDNKDLDNKIIALVGLTFEQFTRSTLLAQNQFAKFIHSDVNERASILELLTGSEIYSRISQELFLQNKNLSVECEELGKKLLEINILSPDDLEVLKAEKDLLDKKIKESELDIQVIDEKLKWFDALSRKEQNLKQARFDFEKKKMFKESDNLRDIQIKLSLFDAISEIRDTLSRHEKLKQERVRVKNEMLSSCEKFDKLNAQYVALKNGIENSNIEIAKLEDWLQNESKHRVMYESKSSVEQLLDYLAQEKKKLNQVCNEKQQLLSQIKTCELDFQKKKEILDQYNTALQIASDKLKKLLQRESQLDYVDLQERYSKLISLQTQQNEVFSILTHEKNWVEQYHSLNHSIEDLQSECMQLQHNQEDSQNDLQLKLSAFERKKLEYSLKEQTVSDLVKEIRNKLTDGDLCPVCGNVFHVIDEGHFESVLKVVEQEKTLTEKAWLEAQGLLAKITGELSQKTTEKKRVELELQKIKQCLSSTYHLLEVPSLEQENEKILKIESSLTEIKTELDQLTPNFETAQQNQNLLKQQRIECEGVDEKLKKQAEKVQQGENSLMQLKSYFTAKETLEEQYYQNIEQNLSQLDKLISIEAWQTQWNSNPEYFKQQLHEKIRVWEQTNKKCDALKSTLQNLQSSKTDCDDMMKNLMTLLKRQNESEPMPFQGAFSSNALSQQMAALLNEAQKQLEVAEQIREELNKCNETENAFLQQYNASHVDPLDLAKIQMVNSFTTSQLQQYRTQIENAEREYVQAESLVNQSYKEVQELHELADRPSSDDTVDLLTNKLKEAQLNKNHLSESLIEHAAKLRRNNDNLEQYQNLLQQQEQKINYFEKVSKPLCDCFGSADGKKFRNIAQTFTLKMLLEQANHHMKVLSRQRYELTSEAGSLAILIRDFEMGGEVRPALTLSGGETFLASLALALGLASLNNEKFNMETIFIDEGFGSLSEESLSVVMNALENLHALGHRVGIISHVNTLRERIPAQIRVKRNKFMASQVEVVLEN